MRSKTSYRFPTVMLALLATMPFLAPVSVQSTEYRTLQVHVVHRHGDRSPITPLRDEKYWTKTLLPRKTALKIALGTKITRASRFSHKAGGRGPFGKLTELGLLQMVQLGQTLRERFLLGKTNLDGDHDNRNITLQTQLFTPERPLDPSNVKVFSTDFQRTIQSVEGLLVGLFDEKNFRELFHIDARHSNWMIPDPQPRLTGEQEELEREVSYTTTAQVMESQLRPLAIKVTKALQPLLADDAHSATFGVVQPQVDQDMAIEIEPLSWSQLAEVTKCLSVRGLLPPEITEEDFRTVTEHAAQRWFFSLRYPRLSYLAMNKLASAQVNALGNQDEPPLTIWSAHDSTLIGLLCAYRLEQPAVWPEYASFLMLELLQDAQDESAPVFVRFSLNGQVLDSKWEGDGGKAYEMIPLDVLRNKVRTMGARPEELENTSVST